MKNLCYIWSNKQITTGLKSRLISIDIKPSHRYVIIIKVYYNNNCNEDCILTSFVLPDIENVYYSGFT